jgi:hypothetical protein
MQAWDARALGKADGLLTTWHGQPQRQATRSLRDHAMSRDCHESGMQAPVALALAHVQPKEASSGRPVCPVSPNLGTSPFLM